jgi:hypothetical protein
VTDHELEIFERQLRQVKPAPVPECLQARLNQQRPAEQKPVQVLERSRVRVSNFLRLLQWLTPATAAILLTVAVVWRGDQSGRLNSPDAAAPALKADDIKIHQELISSFDAVAKLPSGEPVRFRCQTWVDQVAVSDSSRGLFIENRTPRIEVVPIGYETY